MIESVLLTVVRVTTFFGNQLLTNATGFFFENNGRLFLVSSRHVMYDKPSKHFPNRLMIELHTDANNMAESTGFSIPLVSNGVQLWRVGQDRAGEADVAAIEIDRSALPPGSVISSFSPRHLLAEFGQVEVGTALTVMGFPLGFHDTLHHMPVARHAVIASSFGLRFQGMGYFLTDGRTHRGISGAPVIMRSMFNDPSVGELPWVLLGIHSARLDVGTRDKHVDEALGLNCAWYADILLNLTGS